MWFTVLAAFLGKIPGLFGDYFTKKAEIEKANLDYQNAVLQAQIVSAKEEAKARLEYQTVALGATTPIFKQHIFWFLSLPVLMSVLLPSKAAVMWHNLSLIPDPYWTLYSAIVLTIWGIPVASNIVGKVFGSLSDYTGSRRADKIEMQKVSSEQYKKAFADALRGVQGSISPQQWDSLSKALDALGGPPDKVK